MALLRAAVATLLLVGGLVLFTPAGPAVACSCATGGTADHLVGASTVFTGLLVDRTRHGGWVEYTFEVDEVFKGATTRSTRVRTAASGSICGRPGLAVGADYLVFGFTSRKSDRLMIGLCGGTRGIGDAGGTDRIEALTGPGRPPSRSGPLFRSDEPADRFIPCWAMVALAGGAVGTLALILALGRRDRVRR